jgi:hypothetical protein
MVVSIITFSRKILFVGNALTITSTIEEMLTFQLIMKIIEPKIQK